MVHTDTHRPNKHKINNSLSLELAAIGKEMEMLRERTAKVK